MRWLSLSLVAAALAVSCKTQDATVKPGAPVVAAPEVQLPPAPAIPQFEHLPPMEDSVENPTTPEKVALGHLLFFDRRLSRDDSMSCEGCHHIPLAYTSGEPTDLKVGGGKNKRNAPVVTNLGYHPSFYWDGRMPTLEAVSNAAWKGQLGADPTAVAHKLEAVPVYRAHFQRAFKEGPTADNIPKALAAFFRALRTGNAPWDRFEAGDPKAVSREAQEGYKVFLKSGCALCHVPPLYSDHDFHNVGWGHELSAEQQDPGRMDATQAEADRGRFKTPSLRNVALTAPYFHDGRAATLDQAIDFMVKGGKKNPGLSPKLKPIKLSVKERAQLKAFLESLSGEYTVAAPPQLP